MRKIKYSLLLLFSCFIALTTQAQWQGPEGIKYCEENLQEAVEGWGIKMKAIEDRFDEDFKKNPSMRIGMEQLTLQFKPKGILVVSMGGKAAQGTWRVQPKGKNSADTNPFLNIQIGGAPMQTYTIVVLAVGILLLHDENSTLQDQRRRLVEYESRDKKK